MKSSVLQGMLLLVLAIACRRPGPVPDPEPAPVPVPAPQPTGSCPAALAASTQLVAVLTDDWSSSEGILQRFERANPTDTWKKIGDPIRVAVGRSGLGWGRGLVPSPAGDGPTKQEGDGRAPAGCFKLGIGFGYAPGSVGLPMKLEYVQATPDLECVDDIKSRYYNRLVNRTEVTDPDWTSSERMRREDEQYEWGVFVEHNTSPVVPGAGSCIFLHVWKGPGQGTAGCTAMARADMVALFRWLDPRADPVLAQMPKSRISDSGDIRRMNQVP